MGLIKKQKILDGVFWVEIPEINLKMLCGCPADSIKHLTKNGFTPQVERNGVSYESGPNAILLSDVLIQKGKLSNLSEFPLFHMFFTQGRIVPNHPNSSDPKPMLIGTKEQVDAQMEYVNLGNYGLTENADFNQTGITEAFASQYIAMKRRFALGCFHHTRDLVMPVYLEKSEKKLRDGASIARISENIFKISYLKESVTVDINLKKSGRYKPSFSLPKKSIPKVFFSVTHTGEGDGWNPGKPSVSSVIQFNGKFFLVDSGPFIGRILQSVGVRPSKLAGIFITHVHDDHFAGLPELVYRKNRFKLYTAPIIKKTVIKKLAALMSVPEKEVLSYFDFIDLEVDQWNPCQGLEVKPILTAHPVDTTILIFKGSKSGVTKQYGHYCDIAALTWLKTMIVKEKDKPGISQSYFREIEKSFNIKLDLKKVDVGGPAIHGDIEDFVGDPTEKLVLCHAHTPFTDRQLEIADEVQFGDTEILID